VAIERRRFICDRAFSLDHDNSFYSDPAFRQWLDEFQILARPAPSTLHTPVTLVLLFGKVLEPDSEALLVRVENGIADLLAWVS